MLKSRVVIFTIFNLAINACLGFCQEPDSKACPVSANLFPKVVQEQNTIKYIFGNGAIPRRVGISLLNKSEEKNSIVKMKFTWIPVDGTWSNVTGEFVVKPDGIPNCFFLGYHARIPENVEAREFYIEVPINNQIKSIAFSSLPSEVPIEQCPMPVLEHQINEAYNKCQKEPKNKEKALQFIGLLEQSMYKYDCRRSYDYDPVPAWWLAETDARKWFVLLRKMDYVEAHMLYGSDLFKKTLDGEFAEEFK